MEILLKKGSGRNTTTNIKEIADLLDIVSIKKQLNGLKALYEEIKKLPQVNKENILPVLKDDFINKGEVININFPTTIEKDDSIKVGSIYYNKVMDEVRIKKKNGWTNL